VCLYVNKDIIIKYLGLELGLRVGLCGSSGLACSFLKDRVVVIREVCLRQALSKMDLFLDMEIFFPFFPFPKL